MIQHARLQWARAARRCKSAKLAAFRAEIKEAEKKLRHMEANLHLHDRERRQSRMRVKGARMMYRKEILKCGLDPMLPMFQDALTSDEESGEDSDSDSEGSLSSSDEDENL